MKPTIALFIYDPKCSVQSGNGIIRALQSHYNFKIFGKNELEKVFFDDVDMVVVPGGLGDASSYETAFRYNAQPVRDFVAQGGRYLGICMGAYWADADYFNILDGVRAEQYIKRLGTDTRRPHAKAANVTWNGQPERMYFYDGCALVGDENKFETVARYANNDPMAIIQNRVGLIGCHPESQLFWYDKKYLKPHWHQGQHHQLLLEFVDRLMQN
jgi:glutamine amidotransferase-like uncharacterized protein